MTAQNPEVPMLGFKRPASSLPSPRRKRTYSPPTETDQRQGAALPEGAFQARWLIESSVCSRVLGPGGRRFKHMKETTREPNFQARISPKVPDAAFRVFNCAGSAMSISKIAGLLVRYIYDEPENEHSHAESFRYDLKLLVPELYVEKLVGIDEANLRDIEERSSASIYIEKECLPRSTEVCLHLFGVADAVQIAVYFTLETMRNVENLLKITPQGQNTMLFDPINCLNLSFKAGRQSDVVPRARLLPSGNNNNAPYHTERQGQPATSNTPPHLATGNSRAIAGTTNAQKTGGGNLELPQLAEDSDVPQSIITAYDIARDSKRSNLRQVVQIDAIHKGSEADRAFLVENIRRTTSCKIEQGINESLEPFIEDSGESGVSFVIEGHPEENSVALLLIYRFLRKAGPSSY